MNSSQATDNLIDITMPALGADMRDGTLIEWQIKPGDRVEKGDTIAVVETSKGAIEMEVYHSGTISELLITPDTKLPVGSVLARMTTTDAPVSSIPKPTAPMPSTPETAASATSADSHDTIESAAELNPDIGSNTERRFISPAAHMQAQATGIDIGQLQGSGPQGAILLRDLPSRTEQHVEKPCPTETAQPASSMRQAISEAMARSKQTIPHYYLTMDIDLTNAQHWLAEQNQLRDPEQRLLLPALLISVIARLLPRYPALNGTFINGQLTPSDTVNIGNTISLRQGGLVVPAILNANTLTVDETMAVLRDLTERSRRGRLRSSEISEATITITSIGERGADSITGVIYPPQVAIIGLGRVRNAAVVSEGQLAIGEIMTVTLAADHRVSDGLTGARFLHALAKQLQQPEAL